MSARDGQQVVASLALCLLCAYAGTQIALYGAHLEAVGNTDADRVLGLGVAWVAVSLAWIVRASILIADGAHLR